MATAGELKIRKPEWSFEVITECQRFVCRSVYADSEEFEGISSPFVHGHAFCRFRARTGLVATAPDELRDARSCRISYSIPQDGIP